MTAILRNAAVTLCAVVMATGIAAAQQTTTHTNTKGDTVTDTGSLQNGTYTNDRTVTTPNGKTRSNNFTGSRNSLGRLVTSDTHTGVNGRSETKTTTHGANGNKTTVTGPNGHSHTYYRPR